MVSECTHVARERPSIGGLTRYMLGSLNQRPSWGEVYANIFLSVTASWREQSTGQAHSAANQLRRTPLSLAETGPSPPMSAAAGRKRQRKSAAPRSLVQQTDFRSGAGDADLGSPDTVRSIAAVSSRHMPWFDAESEICRMGARAVRDYGLTIQASLMNTLEHARSDTPSDHGTLCTVVRMLCVEDGAAIYSAASGGLRRGMPSELATAGCTGECGARLSPLLVLLHLSRVLGLRKRPPICIDR